MWPVSTLRKLVKRHYWRYPSGSRPWERDGVDPTFEWVQPSTLTAVGAMNLADVWRGVNILSGDVSKVPLNVYRRDGRSRDIDRRHPAHRLVSHMANDFINSHNFIRTMMSHALLHGNAYALITRDDRNAPNGLYVLHPLQAIPIIESVSYPQVELGPQHRYFYWYHWSDGQQSIIPASDMFHLKGVSYNGLEGWSMLKQAAASLGLTEAARDYGLEFFTNNARPNVVIHHPARLSDQAKENLKQSWAAQYSGVRNAHKTAILQEGMTISQMTINARDAMLLETRRFQTKEVANWLGLPPHMLGDDSKVAYNSLEQENLSYLMQSLETWYVAVEQEANDKLLTNTQQVSGSHFFEFDRTALLRADITSRYDAYSKAINDGWMSRNEVREKENMNPIPGPEGDAYGLTPQMGEEPAQPEPEPEDNDSRSCLLQLNARMLFIDTVQRVTGNIHQSAKRKQPDNLEDEYGERFDRAVRPVVNIASQLAGDDPQRLFVQTRRRYFAALDQVVHNGLQADKFATDFAQEVFDES